MDIKFSKRRIGWQVLFFIFFLTSCYGNSNDLQAQKSFIYTENGRLYYPNGEEVSLWGVNFQPNLSWEYRSRLKPVGITLDAASLKKNADEGFREILKMNCKLIRCHLTPSDFTDDKGNLVETIYLDILDYTVAEAARHGIYVYLAFINHMGNGYVENSYMNRCSREEWMYSESVVKCSENYIKQLLNRNNPYSHLQYKNDPNIAVWEVINEPGYYSYEKIKQSPYNANFQQWIGQKGLEDNGVNYTAFRKQLVLDYINGMYDVIRSTGALQPVVWNCNWHKMIRGHEDVFEAIAASKAEVVSFCNYPGQNECKQPYYLNPEDFTGYDFTSFFANGYRDREWYGWALEPSFMKKAKVVYEFETFYNQSAYLYPVMADFYRSLGVQMAAMWTYCFPSYAQYHSGSHFLSLTCTPRKAASFMVAGEIFNSTPLYTRFNTDSPVEKTSGTFAYSFKNNISAFTSADKFVHSADMTGWDMVKPGINVKEISGYGSSAIISYDGTGMYFIKISGNEMKITIEPDATWTSEPWQQWKYAKIVTELNYKAVHPFEIKLPDWGPGKCTVYRIVGNQKEKIALQENKLKFIASPGAYSVIK